MVLRKREMVSLYYLNRLVSITQLESVHCAVRAESLYIIHVNIY
jgi:hypothetical protein